MSAVVIVFPAARVVRIPPARQTDVRVEFARMIEQSAGSDVALIDRWAKAQSVLHPSYDKIGEAES